eukprot:gene16226-18368_t
MKGKGQIHVGRPIEWLDTDYYSNSKNTTTTKVIEFSLNNICMPHFSANSSLTFSVDRKGSIIIQKGDKKNVSESITLKKFSPQKLCVDSNILPGRWEYDVDYIVSDENKWGSCSIHPEYKHRVCSPYYASQYYPDSHCSILPIRQSLEYLHHYLINDPTIIISKRVKEHFNSSEDANVYFYFLGDSLVEEIARSGDCEILSNYHGLKTKALSLLRTHWKPNRFLRRDLPCNPSCLSDPVYLVTTGRKQDDLP